MGWVVAKREELVGVEEIEAPRHQGAVNLVMEVDSIGPIIIIKTDQAPTDASEVEAHHSHGQSAP